MFEVSRAEGDEEAKTATADIKRHVQQQQQKQQKQRQKQPEDD